MCGFLAGAGFGWRMCRLLAGKPLLASHRCAEAAVTWSQLSGPGAVDIGSLSCSCVEDSGLSER